MHRWVSILTVRADQATKALERIATAAERIADALEKPEPPEQDAPSCSCGYIDVDAGEPFSCVLEPGHAGPHSYRKEKV